MTEAEWQSSTDFWPMHASLWEVARHRPRKYRLMACAICRRLYQDHPSEQVHRLLDHMEAYADDPQAHEAVRVAFEAAVDALGDNQSVVLAVCEPSYRADWRFPKQETTADLGTHRGTLKRRVVYVPEDGLCCCACTRTPRRFGGAVRPSLQVARGYPRGPPAARRAISAAT
jgi:hypothetical protein